MRTPVILVCGQEHTDAVAAELLYTSGTVVIAPASTGRWCVGA